MSNRVPGWITVALGAAGLAAAGGVYWYRSKPVTGESGSDPDPDTKPDTIYPSEDQSLSEQILDRRTEGIDGMNRRMEQTGGNYTKGPGSRNADDVTGLVLHQTGFTRGNDPADYYKVTCHFAILPDGQIVWLHPFDEYLQASNTLNSFTVAVEFIGNFPGPNGKCWKPEKFGCHEVSEAQIEAGRVLIQWLKQVLPNFRAVYAHRQSAAIKANDPGPDIWRGVGEWAINEFGLEDTREETFGKGKPIPDSWRVDTRSENGQTVTFARRAWLVEGPSPLHQDEDLEATGLVMLRGLSNDSRG